MGFSTGLRSAVAPHHEVLWDKAVGNRPGAFIDDHTQIETGRTERVPFFNTKIERIAYDDSPTVLQDELERPLGTVYRHDVKTTDGLYRASSVYIPDQRIATGYPFTLAIDTPWFTGTQGHNDDLASLLMRELGVSVVLVGPEYSTQQSGCLLDPRRLAKVAFTTLNIPQALSAESSVEITAALADHHDLQRQIVKLGESRGGMVSMAVHPYARTRELGYIYYDLTDPCVAERLFEEPKDVLDLAKFSLYESIGAAKVGLKLAKEQALRQKAGTIPLQPEFLAGATLATSRAIASGEAGQFPSWMPHDSAVHLLSMLKNTMSSAEAWPEKFANHTNFAHLTLHEMHFGLADPSVPRHLIGRVAALGDALLAGGPIDYRKVHLLDDDDVLGVVA
ncbi:TPA: hypothetical protein DIV49_01090 [Candidatus Saccharibacteria bacterium]|nr:hypothetical protein [Candidatus Saccharibacteria bacterium]